MDLIVLVAAAGLVVCLGGVILGHNRVAAGLTGSQANLRQLGRASGAWVEDHEGRLPGYDWEGSDGFPPRRYDIGGGQYALARNNLEGAQVQLAAILRKLTGRFNGEDTRILVNFDRVPHRRYLHLPMTEYLGGTQPDPVAVSPLDTHLQDFQANPLDYPSLPGGAGPDFVPEANWARSQVINRWPFASSYQSTVYAWSPSRPHPTDGLALVPAPDDSLLFLVRNPQGFAPRPLSGVRFPSLKAFMFEEYDYSQGLGVNGRIFADPEASVNVLFFDGSARRIATADANPGWDASDPCNMSISAPRRHRAIDTRFFPDYPPDALYPGYYRWTRGGLEGIDVGAGEINTSAWCD